MVQRWEAAGTGLLMEVFEAECREVCFVERYRNAEDWNAAMALENPDWVEMLPQIDMSAVIICGDITGVAIEKCERYYGSLGMKFVDGS